MHKEDWVAALADFSPFGVLDDWVVAQGAGLSLCWVRIPYIVCLFCHDHVHLCWKKLKHNLTILVISTFLFHLD